MKTIGLLGGMSWESTALYYQHINRAIQQRLGQLHSAKIALISVDFHEVEQFQQQALWDQAGQYLADKALQLQSAGADNVVLCTNTMHKVAPAIESVLSIPFLHIADSTAKVIQQQSIKRVGLLGTAFTMEQDFYSQRLQQQGLQVITPSQTSRQIIHQIIYDELCLGIIRASSRQQYVAIVEELIQAGAEGIILGCTEIGMLIGELEFSVPLFDTTVIHAQAAVDFALS